MATAPKTTAWRTEKARVLRGLASNLLDAANEITLEENMVHKDEAPIGDGGTGGFRVQILEGTLRGIRSNRGGNLEFDRVLQLPLLWEANSDHDTPPSTYMKWTKWDTTSDEARARYSVPRDKASAMRRQSVLVARFIDDIWQIVQDSYNRGVEHGARAAEEAMAAAPETVTVTEADAEPEKVEEEVSTRPF